MSSINWTAITTSAVTGIVGLAGIYATTLQAKRVMEAKLTERRREAYAGLILALDYFTRIWSAIDTLNIDDPDEEVRNISSQSVGRIQEMCIAVLLAGPEKAEEGAEGARKAAWKLNEYFGQRSPGDPLKAKLSEYYNEFDRASRKFVEIAKEESVR